MRKLHFDFDFRQMQNRQKLTMLNMLHSNVLIVDEAADSIISHLDTGVKDDRIVYEALTRLKVAIGPFIDGLADLKVYQRVR